MEFSKFIIKGGRPLEGEVEIKGAKNAAFPVLAASILTTEPCFISNLPLVEDVFQMIEVLKMLGAEIVWLGEREIKINCSRIKVEKIPLDIIKRFRGSILILGPLLARFGKVKKIPPPGGCLIGARPVDTHIDAFRQLGFKISAKNNYFSIEKTQQKNNEAKRVILKEFSVTATENVLLYAGLSSVEINLKIADQDYQVQELIKVLRKMGVAVKWGKTHSFSIVGRKKLKGFKHTLISDPIETGTLVCAVLATKGRVLIKKAEFRFLELFLKRLSDFGARFKIRDKDKIEVFPSPKMKIDRIQSLPYPGIHTDLQPALGVLASQTPGPTLIHDPLFEGRLKYLNDLSRFGVDIVFCDPHRAIVYGPSKLYGTELPSSDIRAGAALLIAGLVAKGKTIINNIYQIDRGYERIEERLQRLGADIKRVKT